MQVIISEYSEEEHNTLHGIEMGVSAAASAAAAASASSAGGTAMSAASAKKKDAGAGAAAGRDGKGDTKYYRVTNERCDFLGY